VCSSLVIYLADFSNEFSSFRVTQHTLLGPGEGAGGRLGGGEAGDL
jgi:hypothetical protein